MNIYEKRLLILSQCISFLEKLYTPEQLIYWIDIETNRIGIPQRLWHFRQSLKLSEKEFANALGLIPEEYTKYECIGAEVPDSLIGLICEKYGIDRAVLNVE